MTVRRITVELRRPRLRLHFGVRPTIVINGAAQPTQWGVGTWQIDDEHESVEVFLFFAGHFFGRAAATLGGSHGGGGLTYLAPRLPWARGKWLGTG